MIRHITVVASNSDVFDLAEITEHEDVAAVLADIQAAVLVERDEGGARDAVGLGQQSADVAAAVRQQVHAVVDEVGDEHVVERITAQCRRQRQRHAGA